MKYRECLKIIDNYDERIRNNECVKEESMEMETFLWFLGSKVLADVMIAGMIICLICRLILNVDYSDGWILADKIGIGCIVFSLLLKAINLKSFKSIQIGKKIAIERMMKDREEK